MVGLTKALEGMARSEAQFNRAAQKNRAATGLRSRLNKAIKWI